MAQLESLLRPCHAVSKYQSALCIGISNLHSKPFLALNYISRSVATTTDEILYHSQCYCNIQLQLVLDYLFEGRKTTACSTLIQKHRLEILCTLQIQTSRIKANSLTDQCNPLRTARIAFVADVDQGRVHATSSSYCMEQIESLLLQLFTPQDFYLQVVVCGKLYTLLYEILGRSVFVSSSVCQDSAANQNSSQIQNTTNVLCR